MPTMKSTEPAMQDSVSSASPPRAPFSYSVTVTAPSERSSINSLNLAASKWLTESSAVLVPTEKL